MAENENGQNDGAGQNIGELVNKYLDDPRTVALIERRVQSYLASWTTTVYATFTALVVVLSTIITGISWAFLNTYVKETVTEVVTDAIQKEEIEKARTDLYAVRQQIFVSSSELKVLQGDIDRARRHLAEADKNLEGLDNAKIIADEIRKAGAKIAEDLEKNKEFQKEMLAPAMEQYVREKMEQYLRDKKVGFSNDSIVISGDLEVTGSVIARKQLLVRETSGKEKWAIRGGDQPDIHVYTPKKTYYLQVQSDGSIAGDLKVP